MSQKNKRRLAAILSVLLAVSMLLGLIVSLIVSSSAKSSREIANEMYEKEMDANELAARAAELRQQVANTQSAAQEAVQKKINIDLAIIELEGQVNDVKAEIQELNLEIAAKQTQLDEAVAEEAAMTERFKKRLRAMEEGGTESFWAVIFRSTSLSDLLDQLSMISEINEADLALQEKLADARQRVADEQTLLEMARDSRSAKQAELEEKQAQLTELRAQVDQMILDLCADNVLLLAAQAEADEMEAQLRAEALALLKDYNSAVTREQREAALAAAQRSSTTSSGTAGASGFLYPLPSGCGMVTDAYGWRWHPVYQERRFHTGVDLGVGAGTAIYATKSGTVAISTYGSAYGNYVTLQHDDGSASLYGHMTSATVSAGQYVTQGTLIGYVGSTGISTGPHLHFEIYINGGNVNPMEYVSIY